MFPTNKSKIRFLVFYVLLLSSYFSVLIFGLVAANFFLFILFGLLSFLLLHFVFLDIRFLKKYKFWFLFVPFLIGEICLLILGGIESYGIVFLLFSLGLYSLFSSLKFSVFSTQRYFSTGAYLFSIFSTLALSLFLVNNYTSFDFDCDKIIHYYSNLAEKFESYFVDSDALEVSTTTSASMDLSTLDVSSLDSTFFDSVVDNFTSYKEQFVEALVQEQSDLDMVMCSHIVDTIQEKAKKPGFRYSVVFLLFILFFSVIRFGVFLLGLLNMLLFLLLRNVGLYHRVIVKKDCKDLL